jgi:hypothetical protein
LVSAGHEALRPATLADDLCKARVEHATIEDLLHGPQRGPTQAPVLGLELLLLDFPEGVEGVHD